MSVHSKRPLLFSTIVQEQEDGTMVAPFAETTTTGLISLREKEFVGGRRRRRRRSCWVRSFLAISTGICLFYVSTVELSTNQYYLWFDGTSAAVSTVGDDFSRLQSTMMVGQTSSSSSTSTNPRNDGNVWTESSSGSSSSESVMAPETSFQHSHQQTIGNNENTLNHIPRNDLSLETAYDRLPAMRLDPQHVDRNPVDMTLQRTEAGVNVSDPNLYVGRDYHGDSSTATVMGMATGYKLDVYQRFVGSLRKSGFTGHIILGVSPDVPHDVLDYFKYRKVTPKILNMVPCTYKNDTQCADPYVDIKTRWSRFPLQRDWLKDCPTCKGPILTMDVRDAFFQQDPFGPGSPVVEGLQVFEEHATQRTTHWLTDFPFKTCKGIHLDQVMLCSGTTVGTRVAMMKYFEVMHGEMKQWSVDEKCQFGFAGDDQSIHNYLYYSGQLPFATAWPNRGGGIVHTIGKEASDIQTAHVKRMQQRHPKMSKGRAKSQPYLGADDDEGGKHLLGVVEYNLTDNDGWFTEFDGSKSRVIHQWDRFGPNVNKWMAKRDLLHDPFPPPSPR